MSALLWHCFYYSLFRIQFFIMLVLFTTMHQGMGICNSSEIHTLSAHSQVWWTCTSPRDARLGRGWRAWVGLWGCLSWRVRGQKHVLTVNEKENVTWMGNDGKDWSRLQHSFFPGAEKALFLLIRAALHGAELILGSGCSPRGYAF